MCAKVTVDSVDTQRRTISVIQPNGRLTIEKNWGMCAKLAVDSVDSKGSTNSLTRPSKTGVDS